MLSLHGEWLAIQFIRAFLADYISSHEWYDINIYTQRITKLLMPIIKSFVILSLHKTRESSGL